MGLYLYRGVIGCSALLSGFGWWK